MNFDQLFEILNEMSEADGGKYTLDWGNGTPGVIVVFKPGTKILHNSAGPAVELLYKDGTHKLKQFYKEGKLHRLNGPAIEEFDQSGNITEIKFYINGKETSAEEAKVLGGYKEEDVDVIDKLDLPDF
jgi:hypothetical protein